MNNKQQLTKKQIDERYALLIELEKLVEKGALSSKNALKVITAFDKEQGKEEVEA